MNESQHLTQGWVKFLSVHHTQRNKIALKNTNSAIFWIFETRIPWWRLKSFYLSHSIFSHLFSLFGQHFSGKYGDTFEGFLGRHKGEKEVEFHVKRKEGENVPVPCNTWGFSMPTLPFRFTCEGSTILGHFLLSFVYQSLQLKFHWILWW